MVYMVYMVHVVLGAPGVVRTYYTHTHTHTHTSHPGTDTQIVICPPTTYVSTPPFALLLSGTQCLPGQFCAGSSSPEPSGDCDAGYYCTGGAEDSIGRNGGGETPIGHYTPSGSAQPIPCPLGKFNRQKRQGECTECTKGYYCPERGMTDNKWCTPGHFCPPGSVLPTRCPTGTFSTLDRLRNYTECTPCTPGKYCGTTGLQAPTSDCAAGYFCELGAASSKPPLLAFKWQNVVGGGVCPKGHYCPTGTAIPITCPQGKFANVTGLHTESGALGCMACMPGKFCAQTGLEWPTGPCAAGFYCTLGSSVAAPNR